jgi:hypothetical protein
MITANEVSRDSVSVAETLLDTEIHHYEIGGGEFDQAGTAGMNFEEIDFAS